MLLQPLLDISSRPRTVSNLPAYPLGSLRSSTIPFYVPLPSLISSLLASYVTLRILLLPPP